MYRKCTTEKTAAQQNLFEETLLKAMRKTPYEEIAVSGLCRETGLTRNIFYRLFENKNDVLDALLDHTILRFSAFKTPVQTQDPRLQQLESFVIFWDCNREILDALARNGISGRLVARLLLFALNEDGGFLRLLNTAPEKGQTEKVLFTITGLMAVIIYRHHIGDRTAPAKKAEELSRMLIEPLVDISTIRERM